MLWVGRCSLGLGHLPSIYARTWVPSVAPHNKVWILLEPILVFPPNPSTFAHLLLEIRSVLYSDITTWSVFDWSVLKQEHSCNSSYAVNEWLNDCPQLISFSEILFFFHLLFSYWGLDLWPYTCKVGIVALEPNPNPLFLSLFF